MTTTEDPQVWTEPSPKWHLVPPSGLCGKPVEHTAAGMTLSFLCTIPAGHEGGCEPRDSKGRNVLTDPAYRVRIEPEAEHAPAEEPKLTDRQRAYRAAKGPKPVAARRATRAKARPKAETEKEGES